MPQGPLLGGISSPELVQTAGTLHMLVSRDSLEGPEPVCKPQKTPVVVFGAQCPGLAHWPLQWAPVVMKTVIYPKD